jgi:hypothetical protein
MTEIKIPPGEIPLLVQDAGLVTGLLRSSAPDLYFELDWFADAVAQIEAIPSRRGPLLKLLRDLLGKRAPGTPTDRAWYTFPVDGAPSYVYVVLPVDDTTGPASTIGIGILHGFSAGPFSLRASLYVPLFEVPLASPVVVTGSGTHPIELALDVPFGQKVTAGGVTFDGIQFLGNVTFTTPPGFTLAFSNASPSGPQSTVSTLAALQRSDVTEWINAVLGVAGVKTWLDQKIGGSPFTVGTVLAATDILQQTGGAYTFGSLTGLAGMTPQGIAELLLSRALQTLAANDKPVVALGKGGIWVFGTKDGTATDYGLRLQVPDVDLSPAGGPSVLLQLGALLSGDTDDSTWISRSDPHGTFADPGISITLLREDTGNTPTFRPRVDLVSLGLDVSGTAGNPLVNVNGVTLGSLEPRFLLALDFADLSRIPWGVGVGFGDLGIPLGNGISGASANPIAQNLLSSGSGEGSGDKEPVNPAFSAAISRVWDPANTASVNVQLQQGGGTAETIWIPMQRAFGPLQCRRIGVEWPADNPELVLTFLFDGGVQVAALAVDLEGLSLGIPLRTPGTLGNYEVDLQGLGVAFASGPLTVTGGFLKNVTAAGVQYDGAALIQTAGFSISALGSYATTGGDPSLFIFARIGAAFGGPPCFFVTGLCAGFGYNRSLRIPDLDEVPDFPLLAGIDDPAAVGGDNATPAQALASLAEYVAVAQGQNWFAAGVQFTSFELVKSNVVMAVIPTGDFQLAILGVSRIKLGQQGPQFAYAELGLRIVVQPSAGFFGASAVLSPNSYVLVPECHLTGGFAFYLWYGGEHAGDFVVTLGGYHPAFQKPAHYPDVPRLGFSWQVSPNLTIQGGAYFALTPSCAMGGGSLDVEFHAGNLRAWFRAHADFLFIWKPFYFTGSVGVSIGASYKLDLLFTSVTVSVELGAELELWGPPTGGQVHVSWFIISFTIPFGADRKPPPGYLDWSDFATLLPQNDAKPAPLRADGLQAVEGVQATGDVPLQNVLTASLAAGAVSTDGDRWRVRGDAMTFGIATAFPLTEADLAGKTPAKVVPTTPGYFVAVRPMGLAGVTSVLTVTVTGPDGPVDLGGGWSWSPSLLAVPAATWGPPLPEATTPTTPTADTLPGRLVGLAGITPNTVVPTGPGPIPLVNLALFPINLHDSDYLPLAANEPPVGRQPQAVPTSLQTIADTVAAAGPTALRAQLFAALAGFGYDAGANGPVDAIRANVNLNYPDAPLLGTPWQGAAA